jgi:hypothetical protein
MSAVQDVLLWGRSVDHCTTRDWNHFVLSEELQRQEELRRRREERVIAFWERWVKLKKFLLREILWRN